MDITFHFLGGYFSAAVCIIHLNKVDGYFFSGEQMTGIF